MVVEQLIFTVISFAIFVYMFFRMIRNNDTSYVIVLLIQALRNSIKFYRSFIWNKIKYIICYFKIYIFNYITFRNYYIRKKKFNFI